jgi:hypothetical protein
MLNDKNEDFVQENDNFFSSKCCHFVHFLESNWAFSVTGAIEGLNKIVTGNLISLSAQEIMDCDPASKGCAGGYYFNAFGWVINNGGIDTEANYPYLAKNGTCKV